MFKIATLLHPGIFKPIIPATGRISPTKRRSSTSLPLPSQSESSLSQYEQLIAQKNSASVSYLIQHGKETEKFDDAQVSHLVDTALAHDDGQVLNALAIRFPHSSGRIIAGLSEQHENATYHLLQANANRTLASSLRSLVDTSVAGHPKLFDAEDTQSRSEFAQNVAKASSSHRSVKVILRESELYQHAKLDTSYHR